MATGEFALERLFDGVLAFVGTFGSGLGSSLGVCGDGKRRAFVSIALFAQNNAVFVVLEAERRSFFAVRNVSFLYSDFAVAAFSIMLSACLTGISRIVRPLSDHAPASV